MIEYVGGMNKFKSPSTWTVNPNQSVSHCHLNKIRTKYAYSLIGTICAVLALDFRVSPQ